MVTLRWFQSSDLDALYAIASANAADRYEDPRAMGSIYSAPYATLAPEFVHVAEDGEGLGGYVLGVHDTRAFEARLESDWWPALRQAHPAPIGDPARWTPDQRRYHAFHHPRRAPEAVVRTHPAHLHLQLLPRMRRRGLGSALLALWIDDARRAGLGGIHVGVNGANQGGLAFWHERGFARFDLAEAAAVRTVWLGLA